ncbi:MAG TPA: hypothetical protein VHJ79_14105 [Mycobacterium sp.]|nr:hypothetical protein [Mycobacterium sp.]
MGRATGQVRASVNRTPVRAVLTFLGGLALVGGLLPVTASAIPSPPNRPFPNPPSFVQHDVQFTYTGAAQTWQVPPGVTSVIIDLYGAEGGAGGPGCLPAVAGGLGGHATATVIVKPNETLAIAVGGAGGAGDAFEGLGIGGTGGFNGGAPGGDEPPLFPGPGATGGGGGGASNVTRGLTPLVIAGGGGGGGGGAAVGVPNTSPPECGAGGAGVGGVGGGSNGGVGGNGVNTTANAGGGKGGTQDAGGDAGTGGATANGDGTGGQPGSGGAGGVFIDPVYQTGYSGGGGGGGWYGGGGGGGGHSGGGGGGGSGFGPSGATLTSGVHAGNGVVTITYWSP